jgi:hypothetical protein
MKLVLIPKGTFKMGSPEDAKGRYPDEQQHEVEISKPFYLGTYTVTQKQYRTVMKTNPSCFSKDGGGKDKVKGLDTDDFPVETVSWGEADKFCKKLSALPAEKKAKRSYRLPSEAEWEYACRAGTTTPFHFGKSLSSRQANCNGNYPYGGAVKGPIWGVPARWARTSPTPSACLTCTVTLSSGARTGITRHPIAKTVKEILKDQKRAPAVCCAAARGSAARAAAVPPAAGCSTPISTAATSASGSFVFLPPGLRRRRPLPPRG